MRRASGGRWVLPDLSLRVLLTSHRRTSAASPLLGVAYVAVPVIGDPQKAAKLARRVL